MENLGSDSTSEFYLQSTLLFLYEAINKTSSLFLTTIKARNPFYMHKILDSGPRIRQDCKVVAYLMLEYVQIIFLLVSFQILFDAFQIDFPRTVAYYFTRIDSWKYDFSIRWKEFVHKFCFISEQIWWCLYFRFIQVLDKLLWWPTIIFSIKLCSDSIFSVTHPHLISFLLYVTIYPRVCKLPSMRLIGNNLVVCCFSISLYVCYLQDKWV